ncbi:Maf family protein [Extensimonas vulgaris]|uniref:dTTP/UTP pyrophosphatase n=1 Tax=Extensimonas vulgaris TaxID=1031594 RepID=A0A369AIQ8_9BURK|nr:Maf family protein [Extensimonas vulgaris]RCX08218.1 septum formation protein [Extensimonas vulgaris]TWI37509.1 septum formation protein [Extensimonas vulgaris]TXD13811.1 septum formation inhibitor Maf [Extensimonas vulgaris]
MSAFIYLASQSPRRSQLLTQIGVRHELLLPTTAGAEDAVEDLAEDAEALEAVRPGEAPARYVQRVTALKLDAAVARHARRGLPEAPILCADTTVALGRHIFGKPADAAEAERMLAALSGRVHRVLTAVALQAGPRRLAALSVSRVRFAAMTTAQIAAYVATGEPLGKAGAYGVQGRAAAFIAQLAGSYSGIMGLPLYETAQLLRDIGFEL